MVIIQVFFEIYNCSVFQFSIYVVMATYNESSKFWITAADDMKAIFCLGVFYVTKLNYFCLIINCISKAFNC